MLFIYCIVIAPISGGEISGGVMNGSSSKTSRNRDNRRNGKRRKSQKKKKRRKNKKRNRGRPSNDGPTGKQGKKEKKAACDVKCVYHVLCFKFNITILKGITLSVAYIHIEFLMCWLCQEHSRKLFSPSYKQLFSNHKFP